MLLRLPIEESCRRLSLNDEVRTAANFVRDRPTFHATWFGTDVDHDLRDPRCTAAAERLFHHEAVLHGVGRDDPGWKSDGAALVEAAAAASAVTGLHFEINSMYLSAVRVKHS